MKSEFLKHRFIKSATKKEEFLFDKPAVTFLGRSNVGKSSLINAIVGSKNAMKTSKTPGLTRMVNYLLVNDKFYLCDVPGYGFASLERENFDRLMNDFLFENKSLKKIYLLIDSRRLLLPADNDFISEFIERNCNFSLVFTKIDKLTSSDKHYLDLQLKKLDDIKVFLTSSNSLIGISALKKDIIESIKG